MPRRSLTTLQRAIDAAQTPAGQARAHYALALFHDNNSRELQAIPHYEAALGLGLDEASRPFCLAYLGSSLYKTGRPAEAMQRADEAEALSTDEGLSRFIAGLKRRIQRRLTT